MFDILSNTVSSLTSNIFLFIKKIALVGFVYSFITTYIYSTNRKPYISVKKIYIKKTALVGFVYSFITTYIYSTNRTPYIFRKKKFI